MHFLYFLIDQALSARLHSLALAFFVTESEDSSAFVHSVVGADVAGDDLVEKARVFEVLDGKVVSEVVLLNLRFKLLVKTLLHEGKAETLRVLVEYL